MSAPNNGGPAFPVPNLHHLAEFNGMTLRDYFAAKAMQALIGLAPTQRLTDSSVAQAAYEMADAMLKARDEVKL